MAEINKRNQDWEQMDDSDRLVIKSFVNQILIDFGEYASKIKQWEDYYGEVGSKVILQ